LFIEKYCFFDAPRTNSSTQALILRYTHSRGHLVAAKRRNKDLAQPPTIVWRDKQVNVEETPVLEAVCQPTMR
jgi:hypothetical protein